MRALGAGRPTTMADELLGILCTIFAGSLLATVVALALSPLALFGPVRTVEPAPGADFDWTVLGAGVAMLVFVLGGVAVALAYRQA